MSTLAVDAITTAAGTSAMTINAAGNVTFPNGLTNPNATDNRYPFVAVLANNQSLPNGSNTVVQYNSIGGAGLDPSNAFSTSNYRYIAPVAGYYWVAANVRTQHQTNPARTDMLFRKNGAGVMGQGQNQTNANDLGWSAMGIIQCAANDYIDVMVNANGGNSTTITSTLNTGAEGGTQNCSWFMGYLIQAV